MTVRPARMQVPNSTPAHRPGSPGLSGPSDHPPVTRPAGQAESLVETVAPVHLVAGSLTAHSGISRYCRELYQRLQAQVPVRLCAFRPPPLAGRFTFLQHLPLGVEPDEGRGIYHFTRIMGCSLMLWRPLRPAVATVHDLGPLVWPGDHAGTNALDRLLFRLSLLGLKSMDRIVAVSAATAQSLTELLGVSAERVVVVHEGVDHSLFQHLPGAAAALQEQYGISHTPGLLNLLHVGSEAPRKNVGALLQALALLKQSGVKVRLLRVGAAGAPTNRTRLLTHISRLGLDGDVVFAGQVPDEHLSLFYSAADVLVLPSYVEGFGLPVLEAMACGTPVACSDAGALPEVAGDAALLVRPDDVEALADAIAAVCTDAALRQRLVQSGLHRSQLFSWEETARRTRVVYHQVARYAHRGTDV